MTGYGNTLEGMRFRTARVLSLGIGAAKHEAVPALMEHYGTEIVLALIQFATNGLDAQVHESWTIHISDLVASMILGLMRAGQSHDQPLNYATTCADSGTKYV